jgi:hypothetical protein
MATESSPHNSKVIHNFMWITLDKFNQRDAALPGANDGKNKTIAYNGYPHVKKP